MFTYPFSFLGGGNGTQEAATLFLNGVDQYAFVDNSEALGNSDKGTVSAWVNLAALSTNGGRMAFISKRKNGLELSWQLGYRESGNLFEFIVYHNNGSTSVSSVTSPIVGEWYHVAGVYDESNVKLYIDGTNIVTTSIGGVFNSSSALIKVGAEGDVFHGDLYNGSIAIPLVFNVAKTDAEILNLAAARNPDNYSQIGMQVGIPLNTSVLTPEANTITSNGDATLFGSPTYTGESLPLDTVPQVVEPYYNMFGNTALNQKYGTTDPITLNSSATGVTISAWVYPDRDDSTVLGVIRNRTSIAFGNAPGVILSFYQGGLSDAGFEDVSGNYRFISYTQGAGSFTPNVLSHVAITLSPDGNTIKAFQDGVELSFTPSSSGSVGQISSSNDFYFGSEIGYRYFDGDLSSMCIIDKDVGLSGVQSLYNNGKIPYYETLPTTLTNDMVVYYELSSRDPSGNNLAGATHDLTISGGWTSDGSLQTFAPYT